MVIAGRDMKKLEELKKSILQDTPDADVVCSIDYDSLLGDMDMIVTSTSGAGKKVLDIMDVKPGCDITDVARPLDLSAEDVAKRPDVLLCDEPTGALDSQTTAEVLDIFDALHRGGMTVVMVTHEDDVAARAEKIVYFRDGRILS